MHYKQSIIAGVGVLTSAALGYFFSWFAFTNDYRSLIIAAAIALIYIALVTLRMLVVHRALLALGFIIVDIIVFTASFAHHLSLWLIIGAAIAGVWLFYAWRAGRKTVNNMVVIRIPGLSHSFIKSSLRAILFLCIATYLSLIDPAQLAVSRAFITSSIKTALSGANANIIQQITGRPVKSEEKAQIIERTINAFHTAGNHIINRVPPQLKPALIGGLGIIIFFLISNIIPFLIPLVTSFVWCCIQLLLRIQFITIKKEKADKETIIIA